MQALRLILLIAVYFVVYRKKLRGIMNLVGFYSGMASGVVVGLVVGVLGAEITHHIRARDTARTIRKKFDRLERLMPELFAEMKKDLANDPLIRLCMLKKKGWRYNTSLTSEGMFVYYLDDHEDLPTKLKLIEQAGFVVDETVERSEKVKFPVPKFRMSDDFVDLICSQSTRP